MGIGMGGGDRPIEPVRDFGIEGIGRFSRKHVTGTVDHDKMGVWYEGSNFGMLLGRAPCIVTPDGDQRRTADVGQKALDLGTAEQGGDLRLEHRQTGIDAHLP